MPHEMHTDAVNLQSIPVRSETRCTARPVSAWKRLRQLFHVVVQTTPKWVVLVVCEIGISPLRNLRISLSFYDSVQSGLGSLQLRQPVSVSLADGARGLRFYISEQSQNHSSLWIFFTICGRIITHGLLGNQAQVAVCSYWLRPHRADRYSAASDGRWVGGL